MYLTEADKRPNAAVPSHSFLISPAIKEAEASSKDMRHDHKRLKEGRIWLDTVIQNAENCAIDVL